MESAKRGSRVSLSGKRYYFFQGERGINLNITGQKTALIPDSMDDITLMRINAAVRMGYLSVGWPEEKKEIIKDDDIGSILYKRRRDVLDFIHEINYSTSIKNVDKISKLEKILELEKAAKNKGSVARKSVIDKIESYLSKLAGISPVAEEKGEKLEISVTKGTEEVEKEEVKQGE